MSVSEYHVQKADNSSLFVVLLPLPGFVPLALDHDTVLDVLPEKVLQGSRNNLGLDDPLEPNQPGPLVHDPEVPHAQPSQVEHLLEFSGVGEVLLLVFDELNEEVDFNVDDLADSVHPDRTQPAPEDGPVEGLVEQQFRPEDMGGDVFVLLLQRQQFKQPLHKVDVAVVEGGS